MGRVSLTLAHNEDRAKERHERTSTMQVRMLDLMEEREKEASEYRLMRESRENEAQLAHRRWLMSLVNPQTIWIILSILLALVGIKVFDVSELIEATSGDSTP